MVDPRDDNCGEANPVSDVPYDVSHVVKSAEKLSDVERVQFLENCWRPTPSCSNLDTQYWKSGNLNKHIKFQIKWLDQRKWLAYSARPDHIGAWCITCCLFLSDNEKASLGSFVKTPFRTYNKSKEKFDGHETKEYHKKAVERSYVVRAQVSNIQKRIDTQIDSVRMDNIQSNKTVLPLIVDAVMLCAKQQIALRGHRDYNIDFAEAPAQNEGNFIAILRLLAESNPELKRHLISGPANARYTSKTVQNEIISVMADLIRDYFRQCLEETPHFALIADETTSEGREVLSVCFRLLDFADPTNPIQREVLLDLCDLPRTTGSVIAATIRESLERQKVDIANCRGQAYDTTASMSSNKKGVQAEIAKHAPDAEYQGCCLHSLNLVICHACQIKSIQNMMDCCRELYSFFDNSPKRQSFMEIVIDAHSPDNKKRKLKNLCKTRWVERHATFETIFDLYEFIVITLDQICEPTDDDRYYPNGEIWSWDPKTKTLANGLRHTMKNFGHIFNFVCAKEILEPMRPIVTSLQGRLIDAYFGYKKIEDVTNHYSGIRADIDAWFARMYTKVLSLAELVQSTEERPRACNRQQNRDNTPAETVPSYWKRSVAIPLLDTVCAELQSRFSEEKRAHFELCALIPAVLTVKTSEEISELAKVLQAKWEHLLPVSSALESELFRWKGYCQQKALGDVSVTGLLSSHADNLFFPNIRELLKILAVLPIGSTEAERSFSCVRRIHTWLRSRMTTDRLSDLAVIAMHCHSIHIDRDKVYNKYMAIHPRRMMSASLLHD